MSVYAWGAMMDGMEGVGMSYRLGATSYRLTIPSRSRGSPNSKCKTPSNIFPKHCRRFLVANVNRVTILVYGSSLCCDFIRFRNYYAMLNNGCDIFFVLMQVPRIL